MHQLLLGSLALSLLLYALGIITLILLITQVSMVNVSMSTMGSIPRVIDLFVIVSCDDKLLFVKFYFNII